MAYCWCKISDHDDLLILKIRSELQKLVIFHSCVYFLFFSNLRKFFSNIFVFCVVFGGMARTADSYVYKCYWREQTGNVNVIKENKTKYLR